MNLSSECCHCPAFGPYCEGTAENADHCAELRPWLEAVGGLGLDMPLNPQPEFDLPPFVPQLLNGLEVPSVLAREPAIAVGIAKLITAKGQISHRALPARYGPHDLHRQWGIAQDSLLLCVGNYLDDFLERLWAAQREGNIWGRVQSLGIDAATSLNYSIYLDRPRIEHLINIKRSWLTVQTIQQASTMIPIPHLQWATPLDLERQLAYAREKGFHTLTLNLQMIKRQGWDVVVAGIPIIQEQAPDLQLLFTGVAGLRRMAELRRAFPSASFANTTAHYLAQRYMRLQHDDTRLIKEPVEGHPDLILAHNVRLFREYLAGSAEVEVPFGNGSKTKDPLQSVREMLQTQFGLEAEAAVDALDLLAIDGAILEVFLNWLHTAKLDANFRGSFPTWPCSDAVPHPTLGELLAAGEDTFDAFLYLAHLARQVDEAIQVFDGQAGY